MSIKEKFIAKVYKKQSSKYSQITQITIPKGISDKLNLEKGEEVEVIIKKIKK